MIDPALREAIKSQIPKINPVIAEGLAVREMKHVEQYVDEIVRYAERDFPEGLKYIEYRRYTPVDEYIKVTESGNAKANFDVARSDVYMIQLVFEFKGERIYKPLYLPFVRPGGMMLINGSTFSVSPVLADKGISLGTDGAFVQIPRAKLTFKASRHHFVAAGVLRSPKIIHSKIHNGNRKTAGRAARSFVRMETCLAHYFFAKYGVKETFRLFYGTDIHIGTGEEINEKTYDPKDWVICWSNRRKPWGLKTNNYLPTNIRIAIREPDFDMVSEALIGGFFYVTDHFSIRIRAEFLDGSHHEIRLWRILLGQIIGGFTGGEGAMLEAMDEHMESLDNYIDAGGKASLAQGDIVVDDFYQLLYYVLQVLSQMIVQSNDAISTMYDKQLVVLRYALRDINDSIFRMLFGLKKKARKKELQFKDVANIIRRQPKTDEVIRMNDARNHGEVNSVSLPGDNMFFKVTSVIILQTDSGGSSSRTRTSKTNKTKFLHASIAEVGSYGVLPKSEPTGRTRINPWVAIDDQGVIVRRSKDVKLIDRTQDEIRRDD